MANKMTFQATGTSSKMKSEIKMGNHEITIDEPPNMGGTDKGPDPLSTLLASLAGCENVIANLVAKDIKFDLQGIEFDVKGDLDPHGLMGQADIQPYFNQIYVHAKVKTDEPDERIQELKEKTDARCPVFTTFKAAGIPIDATWEKA
ncbi:osmotically inducible protein C [Planococcus antarcticus DSM 14505]|uniref:Osmotically inducible protein C n=1 Tax=Planococcus antarcticus DSM 14505 TaxID=1185653 RepID=A0ABN4RFU2_9BACL|nr:OsmC family protein [Planococcus antarcticus]ANU10902.1 osmotically inducible protein C [Planococcus antarcticus DSM 14505]